MTEPQVHVHVPHGRARWLQVHVRRAGGRTVGQLLVECAPMVGARSWRPVGQVRPFPGAPLIERVAEECLPRYVVERGQGIGPLSLAEWRHLPCVAEVHCNAHSSAQAPFVRAGAAKSPERKAAKRTAADALLALGMGSAPFDNTRRKRSAKESSSTVARMSTRSAVLGGASTEARE